MGGESKRQGLSLILDVKEVVWFWMSKGMKVLKRGFYRGGELCPICSQQAGCRKLSAAGSLRSARGRCPSPRFKPQSF